MDTVAVTITKPLYGSFCYIRDTYIREAIRNGKKLEITIPGMGTVLHDPRKWVQTGKRMEKVFKRPDEPMILYGNHVFANKDNEATTKTKPKESEQLQISIDK